MTDQAVKRYQYLLRTAEPDQIEQAHEHAFASMTPEERQQVLVAERAQQAALPVIDLRVQLDEGGFERR